MSKKLKNTFYGDLSVEKKKTIRNGFAMINQSRDKQIALFQTCIIDKLKRLKNMENGVKRNEISIEHYIKSHEQYSKWLRKFLGGKK